MESKGSVESGPIGCHGIKRCLALTTIQEAWPWVEIGTASDAPNNLLGPICALHTQKDRENKPVYLRGTCLQQGASTALTVDWLIHLTG